MWKQHNFDTIFTSGYVLNIQYAIGKVIGYREIELSMEVNSYFVPTIKNRPHANPNYGPEQSKFEIEYYRQTFSLDFS